MLAETAEGDAHRAGGAVDTVAEVDAYAREVLGCDPALARGGGVHLVPSPSRALPGWRGHVLPVVALAFTEGVVIAARPDLVGPLTRELGSSLRAAALDQVGMRRVLRAVRRLTPHAFTLGGDFRIAYASAFRPTATMHRAELIPLEDPSGLALRHRFDGPVFGVRGPRGLVSWAALKLKSATVWEVGVATEPDYQGRGYARDVVAAATRYTLEQGRVPAYIHDHENRTSAFIARAVGFRPYAEIVLAEY